MRKLIPPCLIVLFRKLAVTERLALPKLKINVVFVVETTLTVVQWKEPSPARQRKPVRKESESLISWVCKVSFPASSLKCRLLHPHIRLSSNSYDLQEDTAEDVKENLFFVVFHEQWQLEMTDSACIWFVISPDSVIISLKKPLNYSYVSALHYILELTLETGDT